MTDRRPEVELDLSDHCIQTAARNAHRRLVDALLVDDSAPAPGVARAVALLQAFLQTADFAGLRAGDPRLAGGVQGTRVVVAWGRDGSRPIWRWPPS